VSPTNGSDGCSIATGCLPCRTVTDRHSFAEAIFYPPLRIIGAFNYYSVLSVAWIASEWFRKPMVFARIATGVPLS